MCSSSEARALGVALIAAGALAWSGGALAQATNGTAATKPSTSAKTVAAKAPVYNFGKPATPQEIAGWDIDVRPDGKGLPPGRGTVAQGQDIYDAKCASCHGTFGESTDYMAIAGGVGTLGSAQPVRTTGSKLNYATTLFDYIRRAMPFNAPQTLAVDEVYALTAYVLNLNDILPADAALDQESLPKLRLPNRNGFTTDHGFMTRDGKPDTHNVACMRDCAAPLRLASVIPDYARDAHGDLSVQTRKLGALEGMKVGAAGAAAGTPTVVASAAASPASELAQKAGCMACHGVRNKIVGPGFTEIATRYAGNGNALTILVAKLKTGGGGTWGPVAMPPQAQVKDADATTIVQWILAGAK
jgi:cytochrome c